MKKIGAMIATCAVLSGIPFGLLYLNAQLGWFVQGRAGAHFMFICNVLQVALGAFGGVLFCVYWYRRHPLAHIPGQSSPWRLFLRQSAGIFVLLTIILAVYWFQPSWQGNVADFFLRSSLSLERSYWDAPWWQIYLAQSLAWGPAWLSYYLFALVHCIQESRIQCGGKCDPKSVHNKALPPLEQV